MFNVKGLLLNVAFIIFLNSFVYAQFIEINAGLTGIRAGDTAWGDYDNDGDLDLLITGETGENSNYSTKIYRNDGEGVFTDILAGLVAVSNGSAAWGDYDNDGKLDILLTGNTGNDFVSRVYHNNGNGGFADINAGLIGVTNSSAAWGDYDNDGDLDILLAGNDNHSYHPITKIYRNNSNGSFTDINVNLPGVMWCSVSWGDYDNDCDLDILWTGCVDELSRQYISRIYRNDGNNIFTDINAGLIGVFFSSAAWGDYDNDGDLDILLSGLHYNTGDISYNTVSKVYRNNGNGTFTDTNASLTSVYFGSASWGDYDNDGDLDILLIGSLQDNATYYSRVYRNEGNDTFIDSYSGLLGVMYGSAAWGDYDNDGDLDIVLTGWSRVDASTYHFNAKIYLNATVNPNAVPSAPANLRTSINGNYINFQWNASTDAQTPVLGLTYALRIGTTPGGCQISSPMSRSTGYRLIPSSGLITSSCNMNILSSSLPEYFYWSVQAIDGAYAGSAFAVEQAYNTHPEITLNSPQSMNFGDTPINGSSDWNEILFTNTGYSDLNVDNVHLHQVNSPFQYTYPNLGNPILPGELASILIRFVPTTLGAMSDTLYIESSAVNMPVVKIRLSGTGTSVPPQVPQNLSIVMNGYDAYLNWDAVTETIQGQPLIPDYYLVYINGSQDYNGTYSYLGLTTNTQYVHSYVGLISEGMFYKVKAVKLYRNEGRASTNDLENNLSEHLQVGMSEAEVAEILKALE